MYFIEYLQSHPKIWFSSTQKDDTYISTTYIDEFIYYDTYRNLNYFKSLNDIIDYIITVSQLPYYVARSYTA